MGRLNKKGDYILKKNFIIFLLGLLLLVGCNTGQNAKQPASGFGNISSDSTAIPSNQYPHTKPILIQRAEYIYEVDPQGSKELRANEQEQMGMKQNNTGATQPEVAPKPKQADTKQVQKPNNIENKGNTSGISPIEQKVIDLTNVERRNNGLPALQADSSLSNVAREKSKDMRSNDYFSHTSPTYGSPFDMMRDYGVTYSTAGENIAQGQPTPEEVVNAWMNSEGHRKNILSADFTHLGVGYDETEHHWTQMFIGK